ncbi:MAG: cytochrome b [Aestuariivirga sp.]|uniref:cytochrome b n=1 Tax=Aestuariivirga sp. TaxID=2650926 RepID=UPI0038D02863
MKTDVLSRYDRVSMLIHWATAALLIFMLVFGEELMEAGEDAGEAGDALTGTFGPSLHVSIGALILALTLLRIIWRLAHPAPALPEGMKPYERILSRSVHGLFYVLLIAIPVTGWLAFGGFVKEEPAMAATRLFGALPMPLPPFTFSGAKDLHELGSNLAIALIALHVLAALKHQFIDRDGLIGRMLPY